MQVVHELIQTSNATSATTRDREIKREKRTWSISVTVRSHQETDWNWCIIRECQCVSVVGDLRYSWPDTVTDVYCWVSTTYEL